MSDRLFFDTNVLIYAVANDTDSTPSALAWLSRSGASVQVLNVHKRGSSKPNRPWEDVGAALDALRRFAVSMSITEQTHHVAVGLSRRHGFHLYDALIAVSASEANCTLLVTEDMHDGQLIDDRLTVHNPFRRKFLMGGCDVDDGGAQGRFDASTFGA